MKTPRQLCIGLSLATTWLSADGWRRADSAVEDIYSPDFYVDIARRAEQACLDFLFRPDSLFIEPRTLADSPGLGSLDPSLMLAAIARETRRIGLVTTASTTFGAPYALARQIQSLNWISHGRAGWNIVTALDGNRNFGEQRMPTSAERYAKALEFVDVVRQLWRSYPHEALLIDREQGRYADARQVRPIDHRGRFFAVEGPLNIPEAAGGQVPLFQAGASEAGRDFAARVADAVFAATPDTAAGVELRSDLRTRAVGHGRAAGAIRVLPGLSLFLGRTAAEADALYRETHARRNLAHVHAYIREATGIDTSRLAPQQRLCADMLDAMPPQARSQTHAGLLRRLIEREQPTLAELLARPEVTPSAHWRVVGTPEDALRAIVERVEAGAADGFIALPCGSRQSLELLFDELIPGLVARGLFRREYRGTTLREHLGESA